MILVDCIIGIAMALLFLTPLGWKWCIKVRITTLSAIVIGLLSGVPVYVISLLVPEMRWFGSIILQLFCIVALAASGFLYRFYRDPQRKPPVLENVILSPADGEVIYIKRVSPEDSLSSNKKGCDLPIDEEVREKYFSRPVYLIGIMMNFLDVHVNRAPIGGRVELIRHVHGTFLSLRKQEAYFQNERAVIVIDAGSMKVGVVQITSRLVRRIQSFVGENDIVQIGQRIGKITFGSQVDLIIPVMGSLALEIQPNQEVRAGLSIIARIREEK